MTAGPRLVVLGDSLAFFAGTRAVLPDDPAIFPSLLTRRLAEATGAPWSLEVLARSGWSVLGVARALARDRGPIRDRLRGADAVVLAVGTIDATPVALPGRLGFGVRTPDVVRLRTASRRRRLGWRAFAAVYPLVIRCTGARLRHTPSRRLEASWRVVARQLVELAPDAALCGVLPTPHRCDLYARSMRHHAPTVSVTRRMGAELGVPLVDLPALVSDVLDSLPDGLHWTTPVHERVADAMAALLLPQLATSFPARGDAAVPASPAEPPQAPAQAPPAR